MSEPTDVKLLLDKLREWLPATSEDSRHIADRLEAEIQAKLERIAELEKALREIAYGQWDGLDAGEIVCRMEEIAVEAVTRETPE